MGGVRVSDPFHASFQESLGEGDCPCHTEMSPCFIFSLPVLYKNSQQDICTVTTTNKNSKSKKDITSDNP